MRGAVVRRLLAPLGRSPARSPVPQRFHLAAQAGKFVAKLKHCLVLLRHVALKVGHLFFESFNVFGQRGEEIGAGT